MKKSYLSESQWNAANNLCYTQNMQGQSDYDKWAHNLQRWGVSEIVAAFIEGAGVLSILLAQFLYFSRPFWGRQQDSAKIAEIAEMLDNNEERKRFAKLIREKK